MSSSSRVVLVALTAVLLLTGSGAHAAAQLPGLLDTVRVADPARDLELLDATASADGASTWLLVASRPRKQRTATPELQVIQVDAKGGASAPITLPALNPPAGGDPFASPARQRLIHGLALGPGGLPVLGLARSHLPVSLLSITSSGASVGTPVPIRLKSDADLVGLARLSTGKLLMLGAAGLRGMIAQVAPDGAVAWERDIPTTAPLHLEEAWPTPDGGAVLLGRSGREAMNAQAWVGLMTPTGEITAQVFLPAYDATLARLADGQVAVVTDHVNAALFDTRLSRLSAELAVQGSTPLLDTHIAAGMTRVVPAGGGHVLIAGVKERALWVTRLDGSGKTVWSEVRTLDPQKPELVDGTALLSRGAVAILAYGANVLDGRSLHQQVVVLRLSLDARRGENVKP
jgi:hypothetical protein